MVQYTRPETAIWSVYAHAVILFPLEYRDDYYRQETFLLLCSYMVWNLKGIKMLVNLTNAVYCAMKVLSY